jgi:hypothetical protein
MLENEPPPPQDCQRGAHELWLVMQAAYNQYQNASAALEALASRVPSEIRFLDPDLQLAMAVEQQRVTAVEQQRATFENYIEARLQFSEFLLSGENGELASVGISNATEGSTGPGQPESTGFWNGFTTSRPARIVVTAALLLPTGFSLTYLVNEQRRVRDLDLVRDAMTEMLNRDSKQSQSPAARLPVSNVTPEVATQPVPARRDRTLGRQAAARTGVKGGSWRPVQPLSSQSQRGIGQGATKSRAIPQRQSTPARNERVGSIARNSHEAVRLEGETGRNYYRFTLTPSNHFDRVGPISLSVRNMNVNRRFLDLSVRVDGFVLDQKHVNLYQPVWIRLRDRATPAALVVTRIARIRVQGYLCEAKYQPTKAQFQPRRLTPLSSMKMIVRPSS